MRIIIIYVTIMSLIYVTIIKTNRNYNYVNKFIIFYSSRIKQF